MIGFFNILEMSGYPARKARKKYISIIDVPDRTYTQEIAKKEIFDFHATNNDFYFNEILNGNKEVEWHQVPIMTRDDLNGDYVSKIPSCMRQQKMYVGITSGSSGAPIRFARDGMQQALVWLNVENHYAKSGVSINERQARFYCAPFTRKMYYKERLKDYLANRYRFVVNSLNDRLVDSWLKKVERNKFRYLYGYAQTLYSLAKFVEKRNITLKDVCPSIKACIVTAEMCSVTEQVYISKIFGVPVANEYGVSEVGVIGYKTDDYWECSDELLHLEVVDEQGNILPDGESGRLLCTCLYNKATPIIRYEIGDLVTMERVNGKARIKSLEGRVTDTTILPSGKVVPGLTFYFIADEIVKYLDEVQDFRILQYEPGKFYVEIIGEVLLSLREQDSLRSVFEQYLEPGLEVSFKPVDEIKRQNNGKFKPFVSLI